MSDILSQEEVDALLNAVSTGSLVPEAASDKAMPMDDGGMAAEDSAKDKSVILYDFRRPDRVSKDQMRTLQNLHDGYARLLSTTLSSYLRTLVEIDIVSVDQLTYSEFMMSISNPELHLRLPDGAAGRRRHLRGEPQPGVLHRGPAVRRAGQALRAQPRAHRHRKERAHQDRGARPAQPEGGVGARRHLHAQDRKLRDQFAVRPDRAAQRDRHPDLAGSAHEARFRPHQPVLPVHAAGIGDHQAFGRILDFRASAPPPRKPAASWKPSWPPPNWAPPP